VNLLIVVVLLCAFAWWEFLLLFALIFLPRRTALKIALDFEARAIHLIFVMFRAYRGFRVDFVNRLKEPLPRRFIVVANHQSLLDIIVIMGMVHRTARARFVAKRELSYGIPLISLLLRILGHSLVQRRGDPLQAIRAVTAMARRSRREGTIPVVFPEGTRSRTGELGTFHSAGYRKILDVEKLPILVMTIDGGWEVAKLSQFMKNFGRLPYYAEYTALLPAPAGKRDALALLETSRSLIETSLKEYRATRTSAPA
jgi:1-acyl-sn-glycerol-3-phosphate acyltransferase